MTDRSEWEDLGLLVDEDRDPGSEAGAAVSNGRASPSNAVSPRVLPEFHLAIPEYRGPHFALACRAFLAQHPALGWCIGAAIVALVIGIWIPQL